MRPNESVWGKKTCVNQFGAMSANEKDVFGRGMWMHCLHIKSTVNSGSLETLKGNHII